MHINVFLDVFVDELKVTAVGVHARVRNRRRLETFEWAHWSDPYLHAGLSFAGRHFHFLF